MWDKPRLLNWLANLLYALSVVLMLYALVFVVVHLPIFPLREVKINGELAHVNREQIKLIVGKHLKGNFFTLDLVKTRDAFQKLPWARDVSVRRRWPDQLEVSIEEHQALARWGNIALVNTHGELFQAATDAELPVFYGPRDGVMEVTKSYGNYSQILNKADIKIAQVTLSPRRSWEIKTNKGLTIALGRTEMDDRLNKFTGAYQSTLSRLGLKVVYADLRYPNGFAVRKPEGLSALLSKELAAKKAQLAAEKRLLLAPDSSVKPVPKSAPKASPKTTIEPTPAEPVPAKPVPANKAQPETTQQNILKTSANSLA